MNTKTYQLLEDYMLSCMEDSAHDKEHIYRVLYTAAEIAQTEKDVDYDILITSCLLHDIGRSEQFKDHSLSHALVGGDKAHAFLIGHGFTEAFAERVRECIQAHSYRKGIPPQSVEAKILFDADKIDASGTVGIARTLIYCGQVSRPLYSLLPDGNISSGKGDEIPSFFQEYKYKLESLYSRFYTRRGTEIAKERQAAAIQFYENIFREVCQAYTTGAELLINHIEPDL